MAEVASVTMALAEDLPDCGPQKQVALLLVGKHLTDCLREEIMAKAQPTEKEVKARVAIEPRCPFPIRNHAARYDASSLAANPGSGLHARQTPRAYPNSDGLAQFPLILSPKYP